VSPIDEKSSNGAIVANQTKSERTHSMLLRKVKHLVQRICTRIVKIGTDEALKQRPWETQYLGSGEILLSRGTHRLIVPGWDLSLSPWILTSGTWEPALTETLEKYCQPNMVALDVGANIGWFSSVMAAAGANVHAFEPNPRLEPFLRKNIFLNAGPRTPLCSVNKCVLGAENRTVVLKFPHYLVGGSGVHNPDQTDFLDSLIPGQIETQMLTVDEFVSTNNLSRVDVIKIDVEGYEEEVLKGATRTIALSKSLLVPLEYTRGRYSSEFPRMLFECFGSIVVLPEKLNISFDDLCRYESNTFMTERPLLELLCSK
jgi:FkbM family methyltransferase